VEQQWIIVRRTYTASGACYGRAAYRKGFHDCVSLLQEMGLSPSGAANSAKNARQTLKPKKIMTP